MRATLMLLTLLFYAPTLDAQIRAVVLPSATYATTIANSNNYYPFGHRLMHYQQLYDKQDMGGTNVFRYLQLRSAGPSYSGPNYGGFMIDMEMSVGETKVNWANASTTWATNNPNPVTVIKRQWMLMPVLLTATPASWFITLPFEKPVPYSGQNHFCFEVIVRGNSRGSSSYQLDAASGTGVRATRLWETSNINGPTAGRKVVNYGLVVRLGLTPAPVPYLRYYGTACPGSTKLPLRHLGKELPHLGKNFAMNLADAQPQTPVMLTIGNRSNRWGPFTLPFDLAGLGAPGCFLNASIVSIISGQADGNGKAANQVTLPNDQALKGGSFYLQWHAVDTKANGLGLVTSRGVEAKVE